MKRIIVSFLTFVLLFSSLVGCGKNTETENSNGENIQQDSSSSRSPMPKYEHLGVSNSNVTSDGRYIYYTYWCSEENKGKLYRADMNFQNPELLWNYDLSLASPLYIDDGYLYFCQGKDIERIDISTGPEFFDITKDGYVNHNSIFPYGADKLPWPSLDICSDDNYFYITSSGIDRIRKDAPGFECLTENMIEERYPGNFYDLYISGNYLYSYCGDDQTIYRISTDGSERTSICKLVDSWLIYENSAYHTTNLGRALQKTNPATGETETLASLAEGWDDATLCNAMDNKLYYTFETDDTIFLRTYDLITGEISNLGILSTPEDNISFFTDIDIVDDYVFAFKHNDLFSVTKMDGTGLTKINW